MADTPFPPAEARTARWKRSCPSGESDRASDQRRTDQIRAGAADRDCIVIRSRPWAW